MGEVLGEMEVDNTQQNLEKCTETKQWNHIVESKRCQTDEHPLSEEEVEQISKTLLLLINLV